MSEGAASTTVFSLCAELPASLPSGFHDGDAVLDTAWLTGNSQSHACLVRRFSAAGATLRVTDCLDVGEAGALELLNGQAIAGHIDWCTEGEAGFVFDAATDVVSTLARNLAILPAERRQVPRVELRHPIGIRHGEAFEICRTRDLSQVGVGVETRLALAPDDMVQIALDGLRPMQGSVRWASGNKAGIAFGTEVPWQTLMPWLRQAQKAPPPRAARTIEEAPGFGLGKDKAAIRLDTAARVREGVRWWNVQVRILTPTLVEFEAAADFAKGAQLWIWLPGTTGWPITVLENAHGHYLAEFRLPLRQHDLDQLAPSRLAQR